MTATDVAWLDFDGKFNYGISVVADATARNALTDKEGRMVYQADTDVFYYNTGAAWVEWTGGSSTGTDNPSFTIDEDNVGVAVDTSVIFERGSSGTDSEVFCTGATGNVGINVAGTTVLEANATNIDAVKPINFDDVAGKTRIYSEGSLGTKNMVFEVETGQSFVFRTVA